MGLKILYAHIQEIEVLISTNNNFFIIIPPSFLIIVFLVLILNLVNYEIILFQKLYKLNIK